MPSARSMMSWRMLAGSGLLPDDALDHGENFALSQPIDGEECHIRLSDPRRIKIRPECHDQQHTNTANPVHNPPEHFQAGGVAPIAMQDLAPHPQRPLLGPLRHDTRPTL
jgi:hypothetical protein